MNAEMRQLLAEASVMAEASAVEMQAPTSHSKPGSVLLTRVGRSTYEEMERRFRRAHSPESQADAIRWARKELDALKGRNRPKPRPERQVVLKEWAGTDYKEVSKVLAIAERTVRRWREEAGLDPSTGTRTWERKFRRAA